LRKPQQCAASLEREDVARVDGSGPCRAFGDGIGMGHEHAGRKRVQASGKQLVERLGGAGLCAGVLGQGQGRALALLALLQRCLRAFIEGNLERCSGEV